MLKYLPNILSGFRIAAVPLLLYLAWSGNRSVFLALLVASLLSDAADGFIARKFGGETTFGAKLDSLGDMATYLSAPVCIWLLYPELVIQEIVFVCITLMAYLLPIIASVWKFGQIASYHTLAAKGAAVLMGASVLIALIFDYTWWFRIAALVQFIVALEYVLITLKLESPRENIKSFFHL